jgi:ketosteroid isomerase-like protein
LLTCPPDERRISTMTVEQEILQQEEYLLNAKRDLGLDALESVYADDLIMTGVLGEPTCGKTAIIAEARRGIAERHTAAAGGRHVEKSAENEDMKVIAHGDTAVSTYRFIVRMKGENIDVHRRYRTTNVWVKRSGRWQIVAAQMSFVLDPKQAATLAGESRS